MPSVTAAVSARLLATLVAVAGAACTVAVSANGAESSWSALLAPAAACPGADDPTAAPTAQRQSIACLVNWARIRAGRRGLAIRASLERAAALKGRRVAACGDFSHTPCGSVATAAVRASGYRYATFGENLWAGSWGAFSARDVVSAWLSSPMHRANLLGSSFRDFGAARVKGSGLLGDGEDAVWVAAFASPRR